MSQVPITILKLPFNRVDKDTTIVCLSTEEVIRENISSQNTQKSVFTFMQSLTMVVSEQTKFASLKQRGPKYVVVDSKLHRSSTYIAIIIYDNYIRPTTGLGPCEMIMAFFIAVA